MTVKELIEKLQELPQNELIYDCSGFVVYNISYRQATCNSGLNDYENQKVLTINS